MVKCVQKIIYIFLTVVIMIIIAKGDPYVKLVVDGKQPSKKTDAARKTWEPVWDEEFTM